MRTIIAGGRNIHDYDVLLEAICEANINITTVISGGAKGVDSLGEAYAENMCIKLQVFPANWDKHGRSAGYIRNAKMAENADALIAVWDGKSYGTKHMIETATKLGLLVYVKRV